MIVPILKPAIHYMFSDFGRVYWRRSVPMESKYPAVALNVGTKRRGGPRTTKSLSTRITRLAKKMKSPHFFLYFPSCKSSAYEHNLYGCGHSLNDNLFRESV